MLQAENPTVKAIAITNVLCRMVTWRQMQRRASEDERWTLPCINRRERPNRHLQLPSRIDPFQNGS